MEKTNTARLAQTARRLAFGCRLKWKQGTERKQGTGNRGQAVYLPFRFWAVFAFFFSAFMPANAQQTKSDSLALEIQRLHNIALTEENAYKWLYELCTEVGPRLSGSPQYDEASQLLQAKMQDMGFEARLQPCWVPHWIPGPSEVKIVDFKQRILTSVPLGHSIGNGQPVIAQVVMATNLDELDSLGQAGVLRNKIVFLNQRMDPTRVNTFEAYGKAGGMRYKGPGQASKYGAKAVVLRSLATRDNDFPHTGVTNYDGNPKIPAVAISTMAATALEKMLMTAETKIELSVTSNGYMADSVLQNNVVAEWLGENPKQIILVGGHLDSWHLGQGAHDDGTGCVQSMEALYLLKKIGYEPRHTLRCVLYANEEGGLAGGRAYADSSNLQNEFHVAAIESDAGGFSPRSFTMEGHEDVVAANFKKLSEYSGLLETYGVVLQRGGSGADISTLKSQKGILMGLRPDTQRYFDVHHSAADTIDAVHPRELALGSAALAAMIMIIDQTYP
jgi:carboxypeptidase Q